MRKTHFNSYSHFEEKKVLRCLEMFHEFALSLYSNFCEKELPNAVASTLTHAWKNFTLVRSPLNTNSFCRLQHRYLDENEMSTQISRLKNISKTYEAFFHKCDQSLASVCTRNTKTLL